MTKPTTRQDQGPWTLRGQGLGLWPKVVEGPGFEDEEEFEVVPAEQLRGAADALEAADRLVEGVLRWVSHVQLEQLTGEYRAARHRAGGSSPVTAQLPHTRGLNAPE